MRNAVKKIITQQRVIKAMTPDRLKQKDDTEAMEEGKRSVNNAEEADRSKQEGAKLDERQDLKEMKEMQM